jgi:hypothetical protein
MLGYNKGFAIIENVKKNYYQPTSVNHINKVAFGVLLVVHIV